jgi:penicillin-binding protein 1A
MDQKKPNQLRNNLKKPGKKKNKYYIIGGSILVLTLLILFISYIFEGMPSIEELESPSTKLASNVYSIDGQLICQFFNENRVEVGVDRVPQHVINALIATEDHNFYHHWGVDLQRFAKAMIKNILLFKHEGASTITQQLVKNLYNLKAKRESKSGTIVRKIREWILAVKIEKNYTKREILEMYFNTSYFGHSAFGISMAARTYFNKDVKDLSIPDAGVLVALLKASATYDPFDKYDNSFRRRNLVMQNMVDEDFLSEEQYEKLKLEPIKLSYKKIEEGIHGTLAPHFSEYIRQQMRKLCDKYGLDLYQDGLRIYTTLDSRMQKIANNAAQLHLDRFQKDFDKFWNWDRNKELLTDLVDKAIKNKLEYKTASSPEAKRVAYNQFLTDRIFVDSVKKAEEKIEVGFVAIDSRNGEIRAMVGGRDPKIMYGLNHATQIRRQAGSAFKPFVYAVAIDNGLYPAFPIEDKQFSYNDGSGKMWSPNNFDGKASNKFQTLRWSLAESINIVACRLIIEDFAPLSKIGRFAEKMGIKSRLDLVPSIALGTSVVTPLELVSAYATISNRGVYNEPISILRIEDKDGVVIDKFTSSASEAIPEETNYILTSMMESVLDIGTGGSARSVYNFKRPAAGKTGTTQDYADAWFVGFTPQLTAGVWVGFDDQRIKFTGTYGQGAKAALPIWAIFMHDVHEQINIPEEDFPPPSSGQVVTATFCKESIYELGQPKLVSSACRTGSVTDIINVKYMPAVYDPSTDYEPRFNPFPYRDSTGTKK